MLSIKQQNIIDIAQVNLNQFPSAQTEIISETLFAL